MAKAKQAAARLFGPSEVLLLLREAGYTVHRKTLWQWVRDGRCPATMAAGRMLWTHQQIRTVRRLAKESRVGRPKGCRA